MKLPQTDIGQLVILAGPSCVGKSPLAKALAKFYPEISGILQPLVLYNSRKKRPGERDGLDYHFRTRKHIENLRGNDRFVVMEVRGDMQALDLEELSESLENGNVFFEGNPFIGNILISHHAMNHMNKLSVFMSPLSREEILNQRSTEQNKSLPHFVKEIMQGKLVRRTEKQKGKLTEKDFEEIERRALSAYIELQEAHLYQYVIPNHDGEDSDNWNDIRYPSGDAGLALDAFVALLKGETPIGVEKWETDLIT